jgi:DNA processing protein
MVVFPNETAVLSRSWLVGLAALDWPVTVVQRVYQALLKGEVTEGQLRVMNEALKTKLLLTNFQYVSIQKFFSEYTFNSFFEWLKTQKISVLCNQDTAYPDQLKNLPSAPPVLWFVGDWQPANNLIAVVGTRHPTPAGLVTCECFVRQLVAAGWGVISGFMYGADIAAQQSALLAGGQTVGVLGFGLHQMYPSSQRSVTAAYLAAGGVLVSAFAPWATPKQWRFLERNRLVAALGAAVVVTEALPKSGTHSTVSAAAEINKTVGVLPSPFQSPYAAGASILVEQGAVLIASAQQFLQVAGLSVRQGSSRVKIKNFESDPLLKLVRSTAVSVAYLSEKLSLPVEKILVKLTELELNGQVQRVGNRYQAVDFGQ